MQVEQGIQPIREEMEEAGRDGGSGKRWRKREEMEEAGRDGGSTGSPTLVKWNRLGRLGGLL